MSVSIPHYNFRSNSPAKVARTLVAVKLLREEGLRLGGSHRRATRVLKQYATSFHQIDGIYWGLAARMLHLEQN
jgi:hypothetical protein